MPEILKDLSEPALVKAIEENMYALSPFSHGWTNVERYTGEEVSWCITDVAFPSCNPIFRIRLKPEAVDGLLDGVIAKARSRKVNLQCTTTGATEPADLPEYLTAHGFVNQGNPAGMAVDLRDMNDDKTAPVDLNIIEVKDNATLDTWCRVTCAGFGIPEQAVPSLHQWFSRDVEMKMPLKFYLGRLNGKAVATSMYLLAEGVAGIYFVATLPEARNRGIGFAVTQKPLLDARRLGYRVGILQASPMGKPVYLRLGFREYSTLGSYSWIYEMHKGG